MDLGKKKKQKVSGELQNPPWVKKEKKEENEKEKKLCAW